MPALAALLALLGPGSVIATIGAAGCGGDAQAASPDPATTPDPDTAKALVAALDAAVSSPTTGFAVAPSYDPRLSLAPMIERVGPSVVSIHVEGKLAAARPSARVFGFGTPEVPVVQGAGSGFIYSADGLVVTNHHVVDGAETVSVRTTDGKEHAAKVLGSDPLTDLALVKIEGASGMPAATLGESAAARVGDWVVAIGSPMGLEHTASVGIVSAKGRGSLGLYRDSVLDFLQTDADIAPGSSGGPLFDLEGRVVGINTAVGPGAQPGFAIPIDQAKTILPQLLAHGKVVRGWLGAAGATEAGKRDGAKIGRVYEGTPAGDAGVQAGDVITKVDGKTVVDFEDLRSRISELEPGHTALLEVQRDGKTLELSAVLAERPAADRLDELEPVSPRAVPRTPVPSTPAPSTPAPAPLGELRLGVQVRGADNGLEITRVDSGSLADRLGLETGDTIRSINGESIDDAADVPDALREDGDRLSIDVVRDGSVITLSMRLAS
ncbi:MAG TPA: trypsin-like peptidase domain-containing protein [Nannocystaceae bacterium]|nr:trypsin-like peptidase domain-containing protein [Nannocystaceae bacterium]